MFRPKYVYNQNNKKKKKKNTTTNDHEKYEINVKMRRTTNI